MVLLVKAHRDFYNQYPLVPWIHGSEMCEHFFGAARQINADFDFAELLEMVPKIGHYTKALNSKEISFNKDKSVREGEGNTFLCVIIYISVYIKLIYSTYFRVPIRI